MITRGEAQLLASTYLPGNLRAQIPAVARELGITEDNVRQRCSRAKRKLTQAVRAEMEQPIDLTAAAPRRARCVTARRTPRRRDPPWPPRPTRTRRSPDRA
ncbi:hypothetical protein GJV82_10775 [Cellulosimicrobium sp. BIT-GX5]|uniref:RNA polymerase sigma-70 region 4 domain-containing protein n=1 Tax=Cellulosimicrobium composti TaxID=2672572 RepID=A0A6N7ZIU8_9MICO|nr:hypothetical protein [Cellulosimicrobium composti]MTG89424.1 hypothetical protein [Cellulosimicrobium composti]